MRLLFLWGHPLPSGAENLDSSHEVLAVQGTICKKSPRWEDFKIGASLGQINMRRIPNPNKTYSLWFFRLRNFRRWTITVATSIMERSERTPRPGVLESELVAKSEVPGSELEGVVAETSRNSVSSRREPAGFVKLLENDTNQPVFQL